MREVVLRVGIVESNHNTLCLIVQAELEEKKKDIQSLHVRIARQDSDIRQLSNQYRSAQQNYERQVCHALAPPLTLGLDPASATYLQPAAGLGSLTHHILLFTQVVEHAAAVNKLNAMEVGSNASEQRLRQVRDEILAAQQAKASFYISCWLA